MPAGLLIIGGAAWSIPATAIAVITCMSCMHFWGFYRSVTRFMGAELLFAVVRCITVAGGALLVYSLFDDATTALRQVGAFWLIGLVYIVGESMATRRSFGSLR